MARGGGDSYRPSTGYRASRISVPRTWVPRQEPRRGTFVMVIPCRYPSTPPRPASPRSSLEPLQPPPLPSPEYIPVVLNDQVFSPCAWRSSSRPSCHPIREGGICPDPRLGRRSGNLVTHTTREREHTHTKREDQRKSWLASI